MNHQINLSQKKKTIENLENISKSSGCFDIKINNNHIVELNKKIGRTIFRKSSLFISSSTIRDLMKPIGGKEQHNYHGLTAEDIYQALVSIKDPQYVFIARDRRYAIISIKLSHYKIPLMMVIETGSGTISDKDANINKVITIYPKSSVDEYIEKLDKRKLLYKKIKPSQEGIN